MNDKKTTVERLKKDMALFVREREWEKYHRPKNLAMSIGIEAAELMELFQWLDHRESELLLKDKRTREKVAHEMADILAYLLALSNVTGIDVAKSFQAKMAHNRRKYPVRKFKGNYQRPV